MTFEFFYDVPIIYFLFKYCINKMRIIKYNYYFILQNNNKIIKKNNKEFLKNLKSFCGKRQNFEFNHPI